MNVLTGWTVQCYNQQNGVQLEDVVMVAVYAETEVEAIKKAQEYIPTKKYYRVSQVIEQLDPNGTLKDMRGWPKKKRENDDEEFFKKLKE